MRGMKRWKGEDPCTHVQCAELNRSERLRGNAGSNPRGNPPVIATVASAILRRSNTRNTDTDDMLDSVTKHGRKLKQRLRGKKKEPDETGANNTEESIDSPSSLLQPVPPISTGGHGGAGSRTSTDDRQAHSRDGSPQPEPASVGGREEDGDKTEVSKGHSRPDSDADAVEDNGPSREAEQVHPSLSRPSIPPPTGKPESA